MVASGGEHLMMIHDQNSYDPKIDQKHFHYKMNLLLYEDRQNQQYEHHLHQHKRTILLKGKEKPQLAQI